MAYYIASDRFGNYDLCHHGIKGQKWGVRRFQNEDMTWTAAGKERYGRDGGSDRQAKREHRIEQRGIRSHARATKMLERQTAKNEKMAQRLEKHGKTAKAAVLREMNRRNQEYINNPKKGKKQALLDAALGGQKWMSTRTANLNTAINRVEERQIQRGMRATLRLTSEKTLRRMSAEEGANYTRSKYITSYTAGKYTHKVKKHNSKSSGSSYVKVGGKTYSAPHVNINVGRR